MAKAIEKMHHKPELIIERQSELRFFLQRVEQALNFAPDRQSGRLYNNSTTTSLSQEIEEALEQEFFQNLYIDRGARAEIDGYIPSQRLILFHGLMGTGKTVVIMKLTNDLNSKGKIRLHYIDCKALVENFNSESSQDFNYILRQNIYHDLKKEYIDTSDENIKGWLLYKIHSDTAYSELKETILDISQKVLSDEEWLQKLSMPDFQKRILSLGTKQNLGKLLEFVKTIIPLVLCFDNVDRFALDDQRKILETCIDLSNKAQMPIILSIRTPNLRRITDEGAKGDFVYFAELERIKPKYIEIVQQNQLNKNKSLDSNFLDASIEQLLEKRIDFIYRHKAFRELGDHFKQILNKFNAELSVREGVEQFRKIFDLITETFVYEDVYSFCNYNIRAILIFYFDFIYKLILNPEPQYSIGILLPHDRDFNITKLRNYLYKWLICQDETIPDTSNFICPNIFANDENGSILLPYKILCYLENHHGMTKGVEAREMVKDFWAIGIERAVLRKALTDLAENQENNEKAMIWLDYKGETIFDDGRVFLMPAGKYFLNRFSISREYVFWMALNTELSSAQVSQLIDGESLDFEKTYNDNYKYQVVYNYLLMVLMPFLEQEVNMIRTKLYPPDWWKGTNIRFFQRNFSTGHHFYQNRLINSILNSIEFANITSDEKQSFRKKYTELLRKVEELEK